MIFETFGVHTVNEDGDFELTRRTVRQIPKSQTNSIEEATRRSILVSGLRLGDFALHAWLTDHTGAREEPYIVTDYVNEDTSMITSAHLLAKDPIFVTKYLARTLSSLDTNKLCEYPDLIDTPTHEIIAQTKKRFPKIN